MATRSTVVSVVLPRSHIFRIRQKSLARGMALSVGAFTASLLLAGFPDVAHLHSSPWQFAALAAALWGMAETARCLRSRWSFYHAGVLILLYSDLLILTAIMALLVLG
ncbi:MAG TPA: permease [Terracidiphilus sp.]|nr:permease [Terracidiphilus sp.]